MRKEEIEHVLFMWLSDEIYNRDRNFYKTHTGDWFSNIIIDYSWW